VYFAAAAAADRDRAADLGFAGALAPLVAAERGAVLALAARAAGFFAIVFVVFFTLFFAFMSWSPSIDVERARRRQWTAL
jgi:hypothetical protein